MGNKHFEKGEEPDCDDLYEQDRDDKDIEMMEAKNMNRCEDCAEMFEYDELEMVNGDLLCRCCEEERK